METIPCPVGPSGWTNAPESEGGREILTPLAVVDGSSVFGAPVVQLVCVYRASGSRNLQVSVRYALPIDLNPYSDFYIGCTVTGHPQNVATSARSWNEHDRIYRLVGAKTWSLATFVDPLGQLKTDEVSRFETVTQDLLVAAQRFAHNCKLAGNGGPTGVPSIWRFAFKATTNSAGVTSSAGTSGSFATTAGPSGSISNLRVADFILKETIKSQTRWLRIHVAAPIDFQQGYATTLRADVVVTSSTDAGCTKGMKGTLLLSVPTYGPSRVALRICGRTHLDGTGDVTVQMDTV